MKYLVVSGGVVSGLGKGITISSLGVLLKAHGLNVTAIKIDPYLVRAPCACGHLPRAPRAVHCAHLCLTTLLLQNTDAGTMSPFEHGEVFVLEDGGEGDLDLGNYERFLSIKLTRDHNITTGKVYANVIAKERRGDYLGKTVQVIPHCTNMIQEHIERVAALPVDGDKIPDVCLIELGGTVGDIESMVFCEALRQFQFRVGRENFCLAHVSLVPVVGAVGEQKTKPTQHTVKGLRGLGLDPDLIVCRSTNPLTSDTKAKISLHCHVKPEAVLAVHDVQNIYHVPLVLREQNASLSVLKRLGITPTNAVPTIAAWERMALRIDSFPTTSAIRIALVGKYTDLSDSYLSVIKSLKHAAYAVSRKVMIDWIEAALLEPVAAGADAAAQTNYDDAWSRLRAADGILVPGGFGSRGVEGKVLASKFARESKIPYLGICLGMQVVVIDVARHECGMAVANSAEFDEECKTPVVIFMPEIDKSTMGATMRLGARGTKLMKQVRSSPPSPVRRRLAACFAVYFLSPRLD